jgi:hypothetical protein
MKTNETPTCGMFYCRDSAEINGSGALETSSWFDSDVLRNRQQKHTAIRWLSVGKKKIPLRFFEDFHKMN